MDVFDLYATISIKLDDFEKGLNQAKTKAESFAKNISGLSSGIDKAYSGIGDLLSPVVDGFQAVESVGGKAASTITSGLKAVAGAATVAAGSTVAVGKSAFDAYADYEQLAGGVETLFKDSAWEVMGYAQTAYKTAGMSANQYMELTTSFVASLLQSLDGDTSAAAKMADMAATDMADNWNKMGSTMESVQDAYKGFAKQNYTMLDNLKLGYGGTKSEMERLLADAEKFSGIKYNLDSYADIISAIHVIQTEMGITGTTALEASTTIQGSVASMKAAWENFAVGIATADYIDDFEVLTNDLVDSVITAGNNVVPRIQEIVERALELGPYLIRGFSEIIPEFAWMGGEIAQTLVNGLAEHELDLYWFGFNIIESIANGIEKYAPSVGAAVTYLIEDIVMMFGENSADLVAAGSTIIETVLAGFLDAVDIIDDYIGNFAVLFVQAFAAQHEAFFSAGMSILGNIAYGISNNKDQIQSIASETITNMVEAFRKQAPFIIEGGLALLEALVGAIEETSR